MCVLIPLPVDVLQLTLRLAVSVLGIHVPRHEDDSEMRAATVSRIGAPSYLVAVEELGKSLIVGISTYTYIYVYVYPSNGTPA